MFPYIWAVGLGKISGPPRGSNESVPSLGSQFPGLGGTPEKRHETRENITNVYSVQYRPTEMGKNWTESYTNTYNKNHFHKHSAILVK